MRYIDNSHGDPQEEALFAWLRTVLTADVIGIRLQSGFFEPSVLGVFMPSFRRLANEDQDAIVLIGSNDGETLSTGVHQLVDGLGLPRPNALLGVVSYANGFYHPKTIHLRYQSGREIAYIGSANLTSRGLNGLNIEAGIILDTDEGDPADHPERGLVDTPFHLSEAAFHLPEAAFQGRYGSLEFRFEPRLFGCVLGVHQGLAGRHRRTVMTAV